MKFQKLIILFSLFFSLSIPGCAQLAESHPMPTVDRQFELAAKTITARAVEDGSKTKPPSDTNFNNLTEEQIHEELSLYQVLPSKGKIGWLHPTANLIAEEEQHLVFRYEYLTLAADDLVIGGDIEWDSTNQSSGCGYSIRVHGTGSHPDLFLIILTRMNKGYFLFSALYQGEPANLREIYVNGKDPLFNSKNNGINHLAVKAQDNIISLYLNRTFIDTIDTTQPPLAELNYPPTPEKPEAGSSNENVENYKSLKAEYKNLVQLLDNRYKAINERFVLVQPFYESGYAGLAVLNSTGKTSCTFTNSWLWIIGGE